MSVGLINTDWSNISPKNPFPLSGISLPRDASASKNMFVPLFTWFTAPSMITEEQTEHWPITKLGRVAGDLLLALVEKLLLAKQLWNAPSKAVVQENKESLADSASNCLSSSSAAQG